jgi:hypothetical protein
MPITLTHANRGTRGPRFGRYMAAVIVATLVAGAPAAASAASCPNFGAEPPNPSASSDALNGVAVLSSCNVWAVGSYEVALVNRTLIVHWNGSSWAQVASPNVGDATVSNQLVAVKALSPKNIWAVGTYSDALPPRYDHPLILHWNGRTWKRVPVTFDAGQEVVLTGVSASSASDVWAVGATDYNRHAMALHWNGKTWKHASVPDTDHSGPYNTLKGVVAVSHNNVWAVGDYGNPMKTLTLHWNGKTWRHVASPNPAGVGGLNSLGSVSAVSASDIWAVGFRGSPFRTLTLHWNGRRWKYVPSPNPGGANLNSLASVAAVSASDVWAAGSYGSGPSHTLIEHWNGKVWKAVPSLNPGAPDALHGLYGIAASASANVWAVGAYSATGGFRTIAIRCAC